MNFDKCIYPCNHHLNKSTDISWKFLCDPLCWGVPLPTGNHCSDLELKRSILPIFYTWIHINGIITVHLVSFVVVAITNYPKLNWIKQQKCIILLVFGGQFRSSTRCSQWAKVKVFGELASSLQSSGESLFLTFFFYRDHLNSLACGLFLHPQSQQQNISDNSSKSQMLLIITRKGSLLLRTHLIQNYLPISRSLPFITQRPLCHVITEIWTWTSWRRYDSTYHGTLANIIFLRFIHVLVCVSSLSFLLLSSIPVYEHITVVCLVLHCWTFGLLPVLGYYE